MVDAGLMRLVFC